MTIPADDTDRAGRGDGRTAARLFLVRHGETAWSLSGQHTGRTDIALTARGEDQARALAPLIGRIRFDHVFTSPARRARRTCALAGLEMRAESELDLAEWDYGAYEGQCSATICEARPGWNVYRDGCPGGEEPGQVSDRADRLIERLRLLRGNIALFSHGQFGCSLAARWIGQPILLGQHLLLATASVSILGYNPSHPELAVISEWSVSSSGRSGQPPQTIKGEHSSPLRSCW